MKNVLLSCFQRKTLEKHVLIMQPLHFVNLQLRKVYTQDCLLQAELHCLKSVNKPLHAIIFENHGTDEIELCDK